MNASDFEHATAVYRKAVLKASREYLTRLYELTGEHVPEPFADPGPHYDPADIVMDVLEIAANLEDGG